MQTPQVAGPAHVDATTVPPRTRPSNCPEPFFRRMAGREKRALGDMFGLKNVGVNLTRLHPGGESALLHRHNRQDEFVCVLEGRPTRVSGHGEAELAPGMCAGHPAGGAAHQRANRTTAGVVCLEVGDRTEGDADSDPADDLCAVLGARIATGCSRTGTGRHTERPNPFL